jgi:hypothetical protein
MEERMKGFLAFVILFSATAAYGQAPDTLWTRTYGGAWDDIGYSVLEASEDTYVIAGYTASYGAGYADAWLLKINTNGDTLWTKTYGGIYSDWAYDVKQTSEGGYILGGGTVSFGGLGVHGWLIRTDSNGDTIWNTCFGYAEVWLNSVTQTSDEGFVVTGAQTHPRGCYAYLAKTDSLGSIQWDSAYDHGSGPYPSSLGMSVLQTTDGGYIVAGECDESFSFFKIDSTGEDVWNKMYSTGYANSIQQISNGGFILAGAGDYWSPDFYLAKSDSLGDTLWARTYGGLNDDIAASVQPTADGGYIVAGYTESFGAGNSDVYLVRTDANGDTLWTKTIGGVLTDRGYCVQQTADGGYIIAGYTESFGAGGDDIYLIRLEADVGIAENKSSIPTEKRITTNIFRGPLQLPEGKKCKVFDIAGRVVRPSSIQPGIYFIEIDGVVTQKVVKVR